MAASATTVDVLAVYGRQFQVVVPVQIGFSRGADGIVVRKDIKRINDLKGKILAASQFTEADFFIRYLAQEAGLGVQHARRISRTSRIRRKSTWSMRKMPSWRATSFLADRGWRRETANGLRDLGAAHDRGGRGEQRRRRTC